MTTPVHDGLAAALVDAQEPDLAVARQGLKPFSIKQLFPIPGAAELYQLLDSASRANSRRESAQKQATQLVTTLAAISRMNGAAPGFRVRAPVDAPGVRKVQHKPRVHMWAELNDRNLDIFWSAELEPGTESTEPPRAVSLSRVPGTADAPAWPYAYLSIRHAFSMCVQDFTYGSWLSRVPAEQRSTHANILESTLTDCLHHLVNAFRAVADVTIGAWPRFTKEGELSLRTVDYRVAGLVHRKVEALRSKYEKLESSVAERFSRYGITSCADFAMLQAQSAREGVKLPTLIFGRTGNRCSPLGTDKLAADLAEVDILHSELGGLEQALLELTVAEQDVWPMSEPQP